MATAIPQAQPLFRRYGNRDGHSGVVAYALVGTGIAVRFVDGAIYLYDRDCPGPMHVARMKALAQDGRGLATYISRRVGRRYTARLDADAASMLAGRLQATRQNTALR
jgi:hypothetical protein